ncbi:transporter substrate-binding domain-containing protein [Chromobacterium vaccinii]|uniref:Transporter substrate-binding domain-containing protein n=1 Tax=Chromobacterium vaccinii TaxID=1108595 RepID=A0ABV0F898_9NEIS
MLLKPLFPIAALLLSGLLASEMQASGRELRVVFSSGRPPFSFHDGKLGDTGIEVDLMRAALQRLGYSMKTAIAPNSRLLLAVADGQADIASAVHEHGADGKGVYYSDGFIEYHNIAIGKRERRLDIRSQQDLARHSFAIWQHGWRDLGPAFQAAYQPDSSGRFRRNYHETASQESQCRMFWANRVELLIIDRTVFSWFRDKLASSLPTGSAVAYYDIFPQSTVFPAAFRDKALRDRFNQALRQLRQSGDYQRILARYRLDG